MTILVAEDEKDLRELLKMSLEREGYNVLTAKNGEEAYQIAVSHSVDLGIFDIMMPYLDGLNLLQKLRKTSTMPVILLTARGEDMDKVLGLSLGADDYLVKPFSMAELLARAAANLRRSLQYSEQNKPVRYQCGDLRLQIDECCLYKNNVLVDLNAKEFLLLKYFMENQGRIFTKKQLYSAVWQEEYMYDDNTVMVHISRLRNKIETNPQNPDFIKTIKGIGYKLDWRGERI